jgi:hypothetical protein
LTVSLLLTGALLAGSRARAQGVVPDFWTLGNCSLDDNFDISDAILALDYLFHGGRRVPCLPLCDVTGDGRVDVADPISILAYLFKSVRFRGTLPSPEDICDGRDNDCSGAADEGCPDEGILVVDLGWDRVTTDEEGNPESTVTYRVHFGRQPGQYFETREAGTSSRLRIADLAPGVRHYFVVTALDTSGNESRVSNEVNSLPKLVYP